MKYVELEKNNEILISNGTGFGFSVPRHIAWTILKELQETLRVSVTKTLAKDALPLLMDNRVVDNLINREYDEMTSDDSVLRAYLQPGVVALAEKIESDILKMGIHPMIYEVVASAQHVDEWRAEAIDVDGSCYVAIFAGPAAKERATEYADWKNGRTA